MLHYQFCKQLPSPISILLSKLSQPLGNKKYLMQHRMEWLHLQGFDITTERFYGISKNSAARRFDV